jgi:hypothetical protein
MFFTTPSKTELLGLICKNEFSIFINRILLTRHTCTSHVTSRTRDLSYRVRRAMLLESERRIEIVYQWRVFLCFFSLSQICIVLELCY